MATIEAADMPPGTINRLDMRIGCYVLFGIATAAVLTRAYVRLFVSRKLGLDDFLIFAAWISETIAIVSVKLQFDAGIGWHAADIMTLPNGKAILTRVVLWPWVSQFTYFFGLGCIKASIVALYLRLAVSSLQRKILWVALVVVFLQGLSSALVVAVFLCSPINVIWTGTHGGFGGPACINILAFNYYNAAMFIITDILLALAPIFVLKNLKMNRKRKASLVLMFSLGLLAIIGTISRQITNAIALLNPTDFTWYWAPAELCSILESSLGIIFVCVPAMGPLLQGVFASINSTGGKYNGGEDGSERLETFGRLGGRPRLRPDDESILCQTRIEAVDRDDVEMGGLRREGDTESQRRMVEVEEKGVKVDVDVVSEYSERNSHGKAKEPVVQ